MRTTIYRIVPVHPDRAPVPPVADSTCSLALLALVHPDDVGVHPNARHRDDRIWSWVRTHPRRDPFNRTNRRR